MITATENTVYITPDVPLQASYFTEGNKAADKLSDLSNATKQIQDRAWN